MAQGEQLNEGKMSRVIWVHMEIPKFRKSHQDEGSGRF
jgi:hypothetical protein